MTNILILGNSGMLGGMCTKVMAQNEKFKVIGASRTRPNDDILSLLHWWYQLDIEQFNVEEFVKILKEQDINYIINAIGITKPFIDETSINSRNIAILINSVFPSMLVNIAEELNIQILQIATDCVFSGLKGSAYNENDPHDPLDIYGKTKSLGEIPHPNIRNLRCSIIGPEFIKKEFLLEWFLNQSNNAEIHGYTNHIWNGITTYHFAKICSAIIENDITLPYIQHVIPNNSINKYTLLQYLAKYYNREDIIVNPKETNISINRELSTTNDAMNQRLWTAAGYDSPPSIETMIEELANNG